MIGPLPLRSALLGLMGAASMYTCAGAQQGAGGPSEEELAKQLNNPVASPISVPFQNNVDFGSNSATQIRYTLNVQPVIPFALNGEWTLITRTILPIQFREMPSPTNDLFGLGDVSESLFFSLRPARGGILWGAGPIFQLPTATESAFGFGKFSLGPTAVVLRQERGWTYGILANHLWSIAGHDRRPGVSATFVQPFVAYGSKSGFTLSLNSETTYDWNAGHATVPFNLTGSQVLKIGSQPISLQAGLRYYAKRPAGAPDWGLRLNGHTAFPEMSARGSLPVQ